MQRPSDSVNTRMLTQSAAASPELIFLIDGALSARQRGCFELSDSFARAAEGLLRAAYPQLARDISLIAARKGRGDEIGARMVRHLSPAAAASVAVTLMLRGSRRRVIDALDARFGRDPDFQAAMQALCGRLLASGRPAPLVAAIEVAAPRQR